MLKGFGEMPAFTRWIVEFMTDQEYADLQFALMENPELGDVMPGCGGLRKLRVGSAAKALGKRGGARVVYMSIPEIDRIVFIVGYTKAAKKDLTPAEKKMLKELAGRLKEEELQWARKRSRNSN